MKSIHSLACSSESQACVPGQAGKHTSPATQSCALLSSLSFGATRHNAGERDEMTGLRAAAPQPPPAAIVGRTAELAQLAQSLARALTGERQLVFISGEPGIGKTTLVETFLETVDP